MIAENVYDAENEQRSGGERLVTNLLLIRQHGARLRFSAFSLLAMLAFTAGHAGGQDEKKFAELDGTWTIIKMEIEGNHRVISRD